MIQLATEAWIAPTVVSSAIAGGVAMATHFSSQKAKKSETREDIRSESFDQAKAFYTDVIERQEKQLSDMRLQIEEVMVRARSAEASADNARAAVRNLRLELDSRDEVIADLRAALARRNV